MKCAFSYILLLFVFTSCIGGKKILEQEMFANDLDKLPDSTSIQKTIHALKEIHPNPFGAISDSELDSLIQLLVLEYQDSVCHTATDVLYAYRKILDNITKEDPHFRHVPDFFVKEEYRRMKNGQIKVPPFKVININDSLLVRKSYDSQIKEGDRILEIDDIPVERILKFGYQDRYPSIIYLLAYYYYHFSGNYEVKIEREGKPLICNVVGIGQNDLSHSKLNSEFVLFDDFSSGYLRIKQFSNNRRIISLLEKGLKKTNELGYPYFIIDLRENPGGTGDRLDEFFSLIANNDSLVYLKDYKVKVSKKTIDDYSFKEDDMGKLISLPNSLFVNSFPLDNSRYVGVPSIYVLISKDTGSTAASVANIIQYNKVGTLVGEPLLPNALFYGDVLAVQFGRSILSVSTTEYNEYTKAKDGIVRPDIPIPYIAREYMKGGDPVLEKLLEYLKNKNAEIITSNE